MIDEISERHSELHVSFRRPAATVDRAEETTNTAGSTNIQTHPVYKAARREFEHFR